MFAVVFQFFESIVEHKMSECWGLRGCRLFRLNVFRFVFVCLLLCGMRLQCFIMSAGHFRKTRRKAIMMIIHVGKRFPLQAKGNHIRATSKPHWTHNLTILNLRSKLLWAQHTKNCLKSKHMIKTHSSSNRTPETPKSPADWWLGLYPFPSPGGSLCSFALRAFELSKDLIDFRLGRPGDETSGLQLIFLRYVHNVVLLKAFFLGLTKGPFGEYVWFF